MNKGDTHMCEQRGETRVRSAVVQRDERDLSTARNELEQLVASIS